MSEAAFIAGDWGTSRLRLYLCDAAGNVLARGEGEGASVPDCAARFAAAVAAWDKAHGILPAVLSGMVGSTIGWREVPYLKCPARPSAIAAAALRFEADNGRGIAILPGLTCRSKTGAPDVMRGEETQILGALRLHPNLAKGRHLFCLPGTHTKWVSVSDGAVTQFQTALSGELFELLRRHSVLARDSADLQGSGGDAQNPAFMLGLDFARQNRKADLLYLLFSARSRVVTGEMAKSDAASYLSGLILGKDIATATALFEFDGPVQLICTPALAALYGKALGAYDGRSATIDGDRAALAGLVHAHAEIFS